MSRMHPALALCGGSAVVLAALIGVLAWPNLFGDRPGDTLIVHCAAGLSGPMQEIAADYERETGRRVEINFDGSAPILARIDISRIGDVFLPADESYIDLAKSKELVRDADVTPLARMKAVLIVPAHNPRKIQTWNDLMRDGVTFAIADPDRAAIGKLTRDQLQRTGRWDQLRNRTTVTNAVVTETANKVSIPAVDAGIVWDVVARPMSKLEMIDLPELAGIEAKVSAAILTCSKQPAEAQQFVRFIAASDKGLLHFRDHGFTRVESGDPFVLKPKLVLYAGAMLRPAIEETIKDFEAREGVEIERVYNGCGILVSQMSAGQHPDLFFACDARFMNDAQQWFREPTTLSTNQLVIAVQKGNPHGVTALKDLSKPGLKVGVGHEQQCALGAITRQTFIQSGVYKQVARNIVVQAPTGDLLINQLRTKALDVVVAYRSNALAFNDIEFTPVTGIPCASPLQPVAVGKETKFPQLTRRLIQALQSAESRQRFEATGFGWEWREK
jgi:molybdate transport system substrate-binding protein